MENKNNESQNNSNFNGNVRKYVYSSLLNCIENERYSNIEADIVLERVNFNETEKKQYTTMLYGTIEKIITIDHQLSKLTNKPILEFDKKVLVLLRMGLYQILYMNSIPDHAAVSETVSLAKQNVNQGAVGLINAVLRRACRELKTENGTVNIMTPDKIRDICGYLSVTYSFPRYLCKIWVNAYGKENAEKIMESLNNTPPISLRINLLKISREDYLDLLLKNGYNALLSPLSNDGIILSCGKVTNLPGFEEGLFFIQDEASNMAIKALNPKEGDFLIDTCACPGGKSFLSAIKMNNKGKILSCDIHDSKLPLIEKGASRLGLSIIETKCLDGSILNEELVEKADKVICDVPCSGFGTISKKPDLRQKKKDDIIELPSIQLRIVENACNYVKKGGYLLYSTCTLNPQENEENVEIFLNQHPDFKIYTMKTVLPYENNTDGFFYAVMRKDI